MKSPPVPPVFVALRSGFGAVASCAHPATSTIAEARASGLQHDRIVDSSSERGTEQTAQMPRAEVRHAGHEKRMSGGNGRTACQAGSRRGGTGDHAAGWEGPQGREDLLATAPREVEIEKAAHRLPVP